MRTREDALRRSEQGLANSNLDWPLQVALDITTKVVFASRQRTATMKPVSPSFVCANCVRALRNNAQTQAPAVRTFANKTPARGTTSPSEQSPRLYNDQPRWKQTPAAMKMPIRLRPQPKQPVWNVNSNQERLDHAYDLFLGKDGSAALDEETKVSSPSNHL